MKANVDVHKIFAEYFLGAEALAYALSATLADGSICLDPEQYRQMLAVADDPLQINPFWKSGQHFDARLKDSGFVSADPDTELKPFVLHHGKVYLHRYFVYESWIIENIRRLGKNFRIITGGPGTGKTYSVGQELLGLFGANAGLKVALAAPTGKAAARMMEAIKNFAEKNESKMSPMVKNNLITLKASTIHHLLGYRHNSVFFRHDANNPLPYDIVIIDEASMIDGAMMAKLLNAIGSGTRLYLIGDKDQLASVEAGSVFGDICRAKDCMLLLDKVDVKIENWRAKNSPHIIEFSKQIIDGNAGFLNGYPHNHEVTLDTGFSEELFKEQALVYKDYIYEPDINIALKKLNLCRFLCVTREYDHSVAETNRKIEQLLKNKINDLSTFNPKAGFYHNQPIIITQNDYNLGLNNGDVGLIRNGEAGLTAYFETSDGNLKTIKAGYLNYYDTVFAMTIHKSQGSEFENVVVLLPEKHAKKLLTRELLYTGVTRARKKILIQSSPEVLQKCIANTVSRASGLTERIKSASL